jgi:hypothetical protein
MWPYRLFFTLPPKPKQVIDFTPHKTLLERFNLKKSFVDRFENEFYKTEKYPPAYNYLSTPNFSWEKSHGFSEKAPVFTHSSRDFWISQYELTETQLKNTLPSSASWLRNFTKPSEFSQAPMNPPEKSAIISFMEQSLHTFFNKKHSLELYPNKMLYGMNKIMFYAIQNTLKEEPTNCPGLSDLAMTTGLPLLKYLLQTPPFSIGQTPPSSIEVQLESVLRKRKKKMRKHKYWKRRSLLKKHLRK